MQMLLGRLLDTGTKNTSVLFFLSKTISLAESTCNEVWLGTQEPDPLYHNFFRG